MDIRQFLSSPQHYSLFQGYTNHSFTLTNEILLELYTFDLRFSAALSTVYALFVRHF